MYDSGAVVQLPFLTLSQLPSAALLNDPRLDYLPPGHSLPEVSYRTFSSSRRWRPATVYSQQNSCMFVDQAVAALFSCYARSRSQRQRFATNMCQPRAGLDCMRYCQMLRHPSIACPQSRVTAAVSACVQEYGASRSVVPGEWRIALAELAAEGTGAAAAQVTSATIQVSKPLRYIDPMTYEAMEPALRCA